MPRALKNKKLLSCNYCLRKFRYIDKLERHQLTHSTEPKSLQCPYDDCLYSTDVKQALNLHINSHTGNRPFICNYKKCQKGFTDSSAKHRHMKNVHGYVPCRWEFNDQDEDTSSSVTNDELYSDEKSKDVESYDSEELSYNPQSSTPDIHRTPSGMMQPELHHPRPVWATQNLRGSFNSQADWYNPNFSYPGFVSQSALPTQNYNDVQPNDILSDFAYPSVAALPNPSNNPRALSDLSFNTSNMSLNPTGASYNGPFPSSSAESTNNYQWYPNASTYDSAYFNQNRQPAMNLPVFGVGTSQNEVMTNNMNGSGLDAVRYHPYQQYSYSNSQPNREATGAEQGRAQLQNQYAQPSDFTVPRQTVPSSDFFNSYAFN